MTIRGAVDQNFVGGIELLEVGVRGADHQRRAVTRRDVHVVLDNSSTHKTPSIQRWLLRHPRFTLHFTPTYSSWLDTFSEIQLHLAVADQCGWRRNVVAAHLSGSVRQ